MAAISLEDVTKVYKGGTTAVRDLNLEIEDGEFIVLVGPSGCGKTTALRMVAGLEEITSGTIRIGDRVVNDVDPGDRDIAMVFQNYALYPHMTVFDNIAFPLRARRVPKAVIRARVTKVADLLGLSEYLSRKPRTLSGGQRQRVAMGRALVREPQAFLMDEPLSNLDAKLRVQMRSEISNLQKELGITTMYVTHDQVEAMTMGMKIAVMRLGVLQQYGAPTEVYADPVNIFVAAFIGSPGMNFMKGQVERDGEGYHLALCGQTLRIPSEVVQSRPALASRVGRRVALGVRPEHLSLDRSEGSCFSATVARVEMLGAEKLIHVVAAAEPVLSEEVIEALADVDAAAVESLEVDQKEHHVNLVVRADSSTRVAAGENVQLFVVPGGMHFFELKGGQAIKC